MLIKIFRAHQQAWTGMLKLIRNRNTHLKINKTAFFCVSKGSSFYYLFYFLRRMMFITNLAAMCSKVAWIIEFSGTRCTFSLLNASLTVRSLLLNKPFEKLLVPLCLSVFRICIITRRTAFYVYPFGRHVYSRSFAQLCGLRLTQTALSQNQSHSYSFIYSFIFSKHFIPVRVTPDPEPVPGIPLRIVYEETIRAEK